MGLAKDDHGIRRRPKGKARGPELQAVAFLLDIVERLPHRVDGRVQCDRELGWTGTRRHRVEDPRGPVAALHQGIRHDGVALVSSSARYPANQRSKRSCARPSLTSPPTTLSPWYP